MQTSNMSYRLHTGATMISTTLSISRRFCGPPNSGNGGYVCGLLLTTWPSRAR